MFNAFFWRRCRVGWIAIGVAWLSTACSYEDVVRITRPPSLSTAMSPAESAPPVQEVQTLPVALERVESDRPQRDPYPYALDKAASATAIQSSAQSKDDWELVVMQWQEAIALMKRVPRSSPHEAAAQDRLPEYQRQLELAQAQANRPDRRPTPIASVSEPAVDQASGSTLEVAKTLSPTSGVTQESARKQVFQAKLTKRDRSTPVIAVTFNGNHTFDMIVDTGASGTVITAQMAAVLGVKPVRTATADTASQKGVTFPIGIVDAIAVDGAVVEKLPVAIAGPDLEIGLLGHDFFGEYDVTIKQDLVEFKVRD